MLGRFSNRRDVVLVDLRAPAAARRWPATMKTTRAGRWPSRPDASWRCWPIAGAGWSGCRTTGCSSIRRRWRCRTRCAGWVPRASTWSASRYGTRAALEYQRLFPQRVRRAVPRRRGAGHGAAAGLRAPTRGRAGRLARGLRRRSGLPHRHPGAGARTGAGCSIQPRHMRRRHRSPGWRSRSAHTRDTLWPAWCDAAVRAGAGGGAAGGHRRQRPGRFAPLVGLGVLASARANRRSRRGMHFSVVCAEDAPRMAPAPAAAAHRLRRRLRRLSSAVCAEWPPACRQPSTSPPAAAVLVMLSGGIDPATPPRHGQRVADAGRRTRHVGGGQAGHGVMGWLHARRRVPLRRRRDRRQARGGAACAAGIRPVFATGPRRHTAPGAVAMIEFALCPALRAGPRPPRAGGRPSGLRRRRRLHHRACWAPTAPARPPRCASPPGCWRPTPAHRARRRHRRGAEPRRAGAPGVLSDARGLYPRLTARENIVSLRPPAGMAAAAANCCAPRRWPRCWRCAAAGPAHRRLQPGERMKTALARALVHDPPNIMLDEPTNGLDVLATRALRDALRQLRDERRQVHRLLDHIMQEVERLCDRVVVVSHGRTGGRGHGGRAGGARACGGRLRGDLRAPGLHRRRRRRGRPR